MPGFIARKLCPQLKFVRPDFTKYTHFSDLTRKGRHYAFFWDFLLNGIIPFL